MAGTVCVPISADLYNEFILRTGKSEDVARWIEDIVADYLERTRSDHPSWSDAHYERIAEEDADKAMLEWGPPHKGYHWQNVFLANGTRLRMTYGGKPHFAEIRHQKLVYEGQEHSPSEFARRVANNTNRNAWRDIWIKRPSDRDWTFADSLRRNQ
jgi:hypothetical protein